MFTAFTKLEEILKKRFMETCLLAQTKLVEIYSLTLMKLIEIRFAEINCNDKFQYISIYFYKFRSKLCLEHISSRRYVGTYFTCKASIFHPKGIFRPDDTSGQISLAKQVHFTKRSRVY